MLTRPASKLTEEDEEYILAADNGCWDPERITHYCVRGKCPLECNGSRDKARAKTVAAIKLSLCTVCALPLEYRWKGMEKALSWIYRARVVGRANDHLGAPSTTLYYSLKQSLGTDIQTLSQQIVRFSTGSER